MTCPLLRLLLFKMDDTEKLLRHLYGKGLIAINEVFELPYSGGHIVHLQPFLAALEAQQYISIPNQQGLYTSTQSEEAFKANPIKAYIMPKGVEFIDNKDRQTNSGDTITAHNLNYIKDSPDAKGKIQDFDVSLPIATPKQKAPKENNTTIIISIIGVILTAIAVLITWLQYKK